MDIPIFPGISEDSEVLKLAENDLIFQLSDYHMVRRGTNITIQLKNDLGLSIEQFYNIIGYSELSRFANIGINKVDTDNRGLVKHATMTFYMRSHLFR